MRTYFIALGSDCCGDTFYGMKETLEAAQAASQDVVAVEEWSGPPFEMIRRWEFRIQTDGNAGQWSLVHPKASELEKPTPV